MGQWFSSNELFLQSTMIAIMLACSVQVALRAGVFSLASIGFYQVSTYSSAVLVKDGWPAPLAIALAILVCGLGGWLLALILVRLQGLFLAMATLAFDLMIGVVALNWTAVTGGALGLYAIPVSINSATILVLLAATVGLLALLERGSIGRMFDMCREDPQVTKTSGVDPARLQRMVFVLSAALGSLAGSIHALTFNAISPGDVSFSFLVLTLAMVIIGGISSWRGAALGAIVLIWLPLQLRFLGDRWPIVYGVALVLMATYAPEGLTGALGRAWRTWVRPKRTRSADKGLVLP